MELRTRLATKLRDAHLFEQSLMLQDESVGSAQVVASELVLDEHIEVVHVRQPAAPERARAEVMALI